MRLHIRGRDVSSEVIAALRLSLLLEMLHPWQSAVSATHPGVMAGNPTGSSSITASSAEPGSYEGVSG
jgi:hypothetical protein